MVYNVIGLMSGSSLDGLDIACVELTEIGGQWSYRMLGSECVPYDEVWRDRLYRSKQLPVGEFLELHTAYGRFLGEQVNAFISKHALDHKIHLVASHGHTVHHNPGKQTSFQLGDGASISAVTNLHVVSDLRNKDVALKGQGAPIVPVAERYLWQAYDFCLNIGGIANITVNQNEPVAFDICPANQVLNHYANDLGIGYDSEGQLASEGLVDDNRLSLLNALDYCKTEGPKSLSNEFSENYIAILDHINPKDALATMCEHIAIQLKKALAPFISHPSQTLLVSGGGAHNKFLVNRLRHHLEDLKLEIADTETIDYKEAIAVALIGILRWREEENVLSSVTGAVKNSVGGALWVN